MTKRELVEALAPYGDDQYVAVLSHDTDSVLGIVVNMLAIQRVKPIDPWHPGPKIIGIVVDSRNGPVPQ